MKKAKSLNPRRESKTKKDESNNGIKAIPSIKLKIWLRYLTYL